MSTSLSHLCELAGGVLHNVEHDAAEALTISDIGLDSTTLAPQALFAALPGTSRHGAVFAADTQAAAVLTDAQGAEIISAAGLAMPLIVVDNVRTVLGKVSAAVYDYPSQELTIIGVTGTSGKTTTSYLLEAGLMAAGAHVGLIGTTGTRINGQAIPTSLTTPEAPTLQALFRRMVNEGVSHVVMEVSSHALVLGRVSGTEFDAAGFSNLSQDHLDFHETMEEYFSAKALFFDPDSALHAQKSVICVDDQWGEKMAALASAPMRVGLDTYAHDEPLDLVACDIKSSVQGTQRFSLKDNVHNRVYSVELPLPGLFNVANATLACGLALAVGIDPHAFLQGVSQVSVPGRMQKIDCGQDFLAVVDYAHKPAAVAAVLDTVRAQITGRLAVVVGAGGDRDAAKRPIMGQEAAQRADYVIITDDNPRSEPPAAIRQAVLEGAYNGQRQRREAGEEVTVAEIGDRREAIAAAISWARTGDAVVIAGKGHEVGQLINGVNHHFSDSEEVTAALHQREKNNA
ncbi:UDP-N-acetylmuramoyl-L-alanyl-D-glutamate--2,6-diaminopimelate ligase [Corynebacterium sp. sy039]|uniref:UDP-N-acetylmuramoyl-L-alanyl-D-glutamate--2, 6-diaminopimelate ligase n=1 Tax=Corynebacterium sp. sy039 TaxID=2599641 RepID=UPI0011B61E96|nr:UDP-N-acetylmuramoyl-L-alanyl-D-glutamate--2,6-diaminopimelate ligase [Corynebacterium sp. sy039]QDZ42922.1 UDP-N-acetylmuramoyl-L-alanyl-D-glutamate--2,6-diaminopimelate ligase [Corynebacterium sp. sy039]